MNEQGTRARHLVNGYFIVEGLNSFATTLFFYYLYFFMRRTHGFSEYENLVLAASIGCVQGVGSIIGGRFAQRRGYLSALKVGTLIMALAVAFTTASNALAFHCAIIFVSVFGMTFTWPALEALVTEGDAPQRLPRNLGIYNLVWAGTGALAYFIGGSIIETWGFRIMFVLAAGIFALEFVITVWMAKQSLPSQHHVHAVTDEDVEEQQRSPIASARFLKMAWLANPLAYVAINTVLAVIPTLSERLHLSVAVAGPVCSLWQFMRAGAFVWLWKWTKWHYRFRWLATAYIAMAASFAMILSAPNVIVLVVGQLFFGLGTGLIYYSSLYYSMHVGEAKGEHGGVHEGMIGFGSAIGPAIGAVSLRLLPTHPYSGAAAVAIVLFSGWSALMWLRYAKPRGRT